MLLKNVVSICGKEGPEANVKLCLQRLDLTPFKNKTVLLKPNIGRWAKPGQGYIHDIGSRYIANRDCGIPGTLDARHHRQHYRTGGRFSDHPQIKPAGILGERRLG